MEFNKYRRAVGVVVLGLVGVVQIAQAKGYSPAVTAQPGGYAIKFSSNGTPLAVPASTLPGGSIGATAPAPVSLPNGFVYPAIATAAIAAGAMLGPWAAVIGIGVAAGAIGVAALDQALAVAKIRFKPNGGGVEVIDPAACTTAPCYEYYFDYNSSLRGPTPLAAATKLAASIGGSVDNCTKIPGQCDFYNSSGGMFQMGWGTASVPPSPPTYVSATVAEAAATMSARSPTQAEVQALVEMNYGPILDLPTITGPASVFKGNTVQLGLDGTVTEIEERYIASFQPGVINIGVEKKQTISAPGRESTTTTTNADGSQSTAVTTSPRVTATVTTTTPLDQAPDPCRDNPGRLGCMDVDVPDGAIPKITKNISYQAESMFGSAACPSDVSIAQALTGRAVVLSYTPTCNALSNYVKPIIIAIALFMAYLIILPGSRS